ncbi:MAG: hypothetical protein AMJ79_05930 [Phycisphaerae bacterium SM23_30]|nr:MAG: hypothetical protein AMJ79_05930 [Phycisphaerae bacterium SM23_30]
MRLHLSDQVGSRTFAKLLKALGGIDQVLGATAGELARVGGIGPKKAEQIAHSRDNLDIEAELALADRLGVRIITFEMDDYPKLLREIADPPHVLYVKGRLIEADEFSIAIVGSRNCSLYGQEQASRLSHLLAAAGFTVVSGMARGIDTAAHRGALAADGRTIAILGCGLAKAYPSENRDLADMISQQGALVSELPLTFEPLATTFPMRNRIISGLTLGVIVVEARPQSGALITARLATEQNREVMAVPGRIDAPGSWGPHQLIKDGAKLVEKIEDVLEGLGQIGQLVRDHTVEATAQARQKIEPALFDAKQFKLSPLEEKALDCLNHEPTHIDEIISRTGLSASQVNAAITSLQLKGLLKQLPGNYCRK